MIYLNITASMVKFFSCPFENNFELLDFTSRLKTEVRNKFSFKIFKGEMKIMWFLKHTYILYTSWVKSSPGKGTWLKENVNC